MERHILRTFYFPYAIDFIKRWKGVKNFGRSWDGLIKHLKRTEENRAELEEIKALMPENSSLHKEILQLISKEVLKGKKKNETIGYDTLVQWILGFIVEVDQNLAKNRMRASLEIETELVRIKEDILQGKFLNENYLAQFPPVASTSPVRRFALYKLDEDEAFKGVDCDVSLAAIVTYALMHEWLIYPTIQKQKGYARKYEIKNGSGTIYRGDTMTSAWPFIKKYLDCLYKREDTSNEFKDFFTPSKRGYLAADDSRGLEKYLYDQIISNEAFLAIIEDTISNEARAFLDNYHKPGNMIICPTNFNKERIGNLQASFDTVDRMLWAIYNYFQTNKDQYLEKLFKKVTGDALDTSKDNFKHWMDEAKIKTWSKFVEINLLDDFVEKDTQIPISMKTDKPIEDSEDYDPMPETPDEFEAFFSNLNRRVKARTKRIYTKITDDYKKN
ncbi:DUF6994 family protein [Turicibacter sp. TA25]|uniref:DUF6994 family protein n=1 Tax=Turicibacter sp. TA25 TaxID=2951142 RepID=UPI0021D4C01D|nr:hypothetical protein [Turicibacter sp. TA25]MCU7205484.1 hypothetical protein [Turicibacter sp. TA25]